MEYIGMITKHNPDQSSSAVVDIDGRLNKGKQRHRQVGFNKQTNAVSITEPRLHLSGTRPCITR